jgi:hypothetical protein
LKSSAAMFFLWPRSFPALFTVQFVRPASSSANLLHRPLVLLMITLWSLLVSFSETGSSLFWRTLLEIIYAKDDAPNDLLHLQIYKRLDNFRSIAPYLICITNWYVSPCHCCFQPIEINTSTVCSIISGSSATFGTSSFTQSTVYFFLKSNQQFSKPTTISVSTPNLRLRFLVGGGETTHKQFCIPTTNSYMLRKQKARAYLSAYGQNYVSGCFSYIFAHLMQPAVILLLFFNF